MATYNGSRYIRCQLETILSQLTPNDELIISDDASSDDTREIILEVCGERARLLQGNFRNPALNFENALHHASGEIIVFSDQDDLWLPGKLALVREKLGPRCQVPALIMLDGEIVDAAEKIIEPSIFVKKKSAPGLLRNIYDSCYPGCCMAFTRPLLVLALPLPRRVPMHDWWIALLAELFAEIEFVPVKTIRYRRHGDNASFTSHDRWLKVWRRLHISRLLLVRYFAIKCGGHQGRRL